MKYIKSSVVFTCFLSLFIIFNSQFLYSQTGWVNQYYNGTVLPINKIFFIDENTGWAESSGGYSFISAGDFFRTTNGGLNWTLILHNSISCYSFHFINNLSGWMTGGYWDDIGGSGRYYYKTTNGGLNWNLKLYDTLSGTYNSVYFANASTGWIAGSLNNQGIIMRSTDSGETWSSDVVSQGNNLRCLYFVNSYTGWMLGVQGKILKSTNSGLNWFEQANLGNYLNSLYFVNTNLGWVAGNNANIFKTTNSGINWAQQNSGINNDLQSVYFINPDTGWVSGNEGKIIYTSNGGSYWIQQSSNTTDDLKSIFFINNNTGWSAGGFQMITGSCTILKTTTGGLIPVKQLGENVPVKYSLYQNYPNPFNPVTKIKFDIPSLGKYEVTIRMTIYDVLGRETAIIVNEPKMKPGGYEVEWDGSNYPSGVYFYKLKAGNYSETRKMILLK